MIHCQKLLKQGFQPRLWAPSSPTRGENGSSGRRDSHNCMPHRIQQDLSARIQVENYSRNTLGSRLLCILDRTTMQHNWWATGHNTIRECRSKLCHRASQVYLQRLKPARKTQPRRVQFYSRSSRHRMERLLLILVGSLAAHRPP